MIKKDRKRSLVQVALALLGLSLVAQTASLRSEGLADYGARLCAESDVPADECTLSGPAMAGSDATAEPLSPAETPGKTATLIDHGEWVCAKEGVSMEECLALPSPSRTDASAAAVSPFGVVPARIPVVTGIPLPAPPVVRDPGLAEGARVAGQPVPLQARPVRYAAPPPLPAEPGLRVAGPPAASPGPAFRYAERSPAPIDPPFRYAFPVDPTFRVVAPPASPVGPAVGFLAPPAVIVDPDDPAFLATRRDVLIDRAAPTFFDDEAGGPAGVVAGGRTERCWRAVRYSGSPPYRYVSC